MARPIAQAKAYYYPTPDEMGREIAALIGYKSGMNILDPCAGTGEFIEPIYNAYHEEMGRKPTVRTIELDITRHKGILARKWGLERNHLQGDSFKASIPISSVGLVLLNPPYDRGVMEREWVERWVPSICLGGVLALIIPVTALSLIREFLASHFEDVRIARFSDPHYEIYKQIVIIGRRRSEELDQTVLNDLTVENVEDLAILGVDTIPTVYTRYGGSYIGSWKVERIDIDLAVRAHKPWTSVRRRVESTISETLGSITNILESVSTPRFTTVLPPPVAHISLALAAGALDGAVLSPDQNDAGLPPIAIRGCYERDWVEIRIKTNKDGAQTGVEEQQVPTLSISVLSLVSGRIHNLAQVVDPSYDPDLYQSLESDSEAWTEYRLYDENPLTSPLQLFSTGDLLIHYGESIRDIINERCVPIYVPERDGDMCDGILDLFPRTPFRAQRNVINANIKTHELRPEWPRTMVSGQTGSGKTTISAQTAVAWCIKHPVQPAGLDRIQRILVTCPPHLVAEWIDNQLPEILGSDIEVVELENLSSVDHWMEDDRPFGGLAVRGVRVSIGILSRSKAKAGYRVVGIDDIQKPVGRADDGSTIYETRSPSCPDCGHPASLLTSVEKRGRKRERCKGRVDMKPVTKDGDYCHLSHILQPLFGRDPNPARILKTLIVEILAERIEITQEIQSGLEMLIHMVPAPVIHSLPPPRLVLMGQIFKSTFQAENQDVGAVLRSIIISAIQHDRCGPEVALMIGELRIESETAGISWPADIPAYNYQGSWDGVQPGSAGAVQLCTERFEAITRYESSLCDAMLWTAYPGDAGGYRRYPLAKYIHRKYKNRIQFFISDEAHEAANSDSAQSQAEQLAFKLGCPFISMTGTTGNGFPRSYHVILYHASEDYRREFKYNESGRFQKDFGYNKRVQETVDEAGKVIAYGSTSAARVRTKALGTPAPGIVPSAVMRFITPIAIPISVNDLGIDLPPCTERVIRVRPDDDQLSEYHQLMVRLRQQAIKDRFSEKNGALMGMLAQAGTILDRNLTDVGNHPDGGFEIRYSERWGFERVAYSRGIERDRILPKEQALLEYVQENLASGNRTIVGVWHVAQGAERSLTDRIQTLLESNGISCATLVSQKVSPKKRIAWIQKQVVNKGVDVLICNPRAIKTGINNLVYFSRIAIFDHLGSSPEVYDQFRGRIHRPGQTVPTEMVVFLYQDTVQVIAHEHLMAKVAVVRATDGTDPREALRSVGAEGIGSVSYSMSLAEKILRMG